MKKIIILLFIMSSNIYSAQSMRRCMLLPIQDSVGGAIAYKVFEELEYYLKEGSWCYYQSNSELIDILSRHRKNIEQHLENKEVLALVAEKARAGSLIKINIVSQIKGVDVTVAVLGANGEDVYFKEETRLDTDDITVIAQTIKNWLDVYEKTVPYDGRIIGVLGEQFTVDLGSDFGAKANSEILIERMTQKRPHPLLKEIVDWQTKRIARGKLFHTTATQSQGKIIELEPKQQLRVDDWVRFVKSENKKLTEVTELNYGDNSDYEFGKLGVLSLYLNLGSGSTATTTSSGSLKKVGGIVLGAEVKGEVWATRNFWGSLEYAKKYASFKAKEGSLSSTSNSATFGNTKLKLGYRYLPLGFFFGPQIDLYLGYGHYSYGLDTEGSDGFADAAFKGVLGGVKGSMPVKQLYRIFVGLDFLIAPKYTEEVTVNGSVDSASTYQLNLGANYSYSPSLTLEGILSFVGSTAKFEPASNGIAQAKYKDTSLKFGATFSF